MSTAAKLILQLLIAMVGGYLIGYVLSDIPYIAIPLAFAFGFFVPSMLIKDDK